MPRGVSAPDLKNEAPGRCIQGTHVAYLAVLAPAPHDHGLFLASKPQQED
jgi:hypothetical protein